MKEHKGFRFMYDRIAKWDKGELPFSLDDKWNRYGMVGILADYVLFFVKGNIIEIGVGETSVFLSRVAKKYKRKVYHCDISLGTMEAIKSVPGIFNKNSIAYTGSSDKFFKNVKFGPIALVYIDGGHTYDQVKKDFDNSLKLLSKGGFILLHDTCPPNKSWHSPARCGTVYQLRQEIEKRSDVEIFSFPYVALGVGLSIVQRINRIGEDK